MGKSGDAASLACDAAGARDAPGVNVAPQGQAKLFHLQVIRRMQAMAGGNSGASMSLGA